MDQNLTSNLTDPNGCPPLPQSTLFGASCQLFAYSTIFILSVFGNCILIGAITSNVSRTHAVMNYYIINMAAADLFTTVFNIGIQVYHYGLMIVNKQFEWFDGIAGVILCKFTAFIQGAAIACSVVTLAAIAINRFLAVMYPFHRSRRNSTAVLVIFLTWMSSFAIASPMLYAMQVENEDGALYCVENWEPLFDNHSSKYYTLVLFLSLFACPLAIIGTLYSIIAFKVWVRTVPGHITGANQQHEIKTRKKILKICMTVVLVFALCWLPFYVYLIFQFVSAKNNGCNAPEYVAFLGLFFAHANSAISPFIYVVYNSDYQKGMKKIVKLCRCPCKSSQVRMRKTRRALESMPSLRSFRELELTSL